MLLSDDNIRSLAAEQLQTVWLGRASFGISSNDPLDVLHIAPRTLAEKHLLLNVELVPDIPSSSSERDSNVEIAGVLSRPDRTIFLSKKFQTTYRRFTLAHEIGHFLMHPGLELHRDRPLAGSLNLLRQRGQTERQADLFAAELLMPPKQLRPVFNRNFGTSIHPSGSDSQLIYRLQVGTGRPQQQIRRCMSDSMAAALLVAQAQSFGLNGFEPLFNLFAVSPTAMAIQLLDLGLVG